VMCDHCKFTWTDFITVVSYATTSFIVIRWESAIPYQRVADIETARHAIMDNKEQDIIKFTSVLSSP
jgi:hypothetical protein